MTGFLLLLSFAGFTFSLSLWFFALAVNLAVLEPFLIFSGYPAQPHLETAIGLFFLPLLTVIFEKNGFIRNPVRQISKQNVFTAFIALLSLLFFFAAADKRLYFHITLFLYALLLWTSSSRPVGHDDIGKSTDDFFSLSLLLAITGFGLWILYDISDFSNAYLAGKIFIVYGSMNFAFFALFPHFAKSRSDLKYLRLFIYMYIASILYEALVLIFFKERPPAVIGNGIRLAISAYWFFAMIRLHEIRNITSWNIILWITAAFHLAGLAGLTFLSETGIHYGHLYLAGALTPVLLLSLPLTGSKDAANLKGIMFLITAALIFFAALTRATAHTMPASNQTHLAYASFVMLAAVLLIIFRYRNALFKKN